MKKEDFINPQVLERATLEQAYEFQKKLIYLGKGYWRESTAWFNDKEVTEVAIVKVDG